MIISFANKLASDLFNDLETSATRRFPAELRRIAQRKLQYLHAAAKLSDLRVPPGNRLEALKGDRAGQHSIRVNDQWRVVFIWDSGNAIEVAIVDYH